MSNADVYCNTDDNENQNVHEWFIYPVWSIGACIAFASTFFSLSHSDRSSEYEYEYLYIYAN